MNEADEEKTAFICPARFYQFQRMPQKICGAPSTFQRVMEKPVGDMNLLDVLVYLDELIIFGRTLVEHYYLLLFFALFATCIVYLSLSAMRDSHVINSGK